jgi:uncharacterized protein (DUF433 family)
MRGKEVAVLDITNVVAAFSEEQASRLTRLSLNRLRYWAKTGFFAPSYIEEENAAAPYSRFYSFKDVVALRTLEMLRVKNGVPLQHLRKVAEKLAHLRDDLWTETRLRVANRKVVFDEPESGRAREVLSGQFVEEYALVEVIGEASREVEQLKSRRPDEIGNVVQMRGVNRGAPTIAGTRIPVVSVQRLHEDGYSIEQILAEYPRLTEADVRAALAHTLVAAAA